MQIPEDGAIEGEKKKWGKKQHISAEKLRRLRDRIYCLAWSQFKNRFPVECPARPFRVFLLKIPSERHRAIRLTRIRIPTRRRPILYLLSNRRDRISKPSNRRCPFAHFPLNPQRLPPNSSDRTRTHEWTGPERTNFPSFIDCLAFRTIQKNN